MLSDLDIISPPEITIFLLHRMLYDSTITPPSEQISPR